MAMRKLRIRKHRSIEVTLKCSNLAEIFLLFIFQQLQLLRRCCTNNLLRRRKGGDLYCLFIFNLNFEYLPAKYTARWKCSRKSCEKWLCIRCLVKRFNAIYFLHFPLGCEERENEKTFRSFEDSEMIKWHALCVYLVFSQLNQRAALPLLLHVSMSSFFISCILRGNNSSSWCLSEHIKIMGGVLPWACRE